MLPYFQRGPSAGLGGVIKLSNEGRGDAGYPLFYNAMRYEVSVSRGCYYEAYFFNSEAEARDKFTDMLVKYGPDYNVELTKIEKQ